MSTNLRKERGISLKKILILFLALSCAPFCLANGENHNNATTVTANGGSATGGSAQQSQQQSQEATAQNGNQANQMSTTFQYPHQAPSVAGPWVDVTSPCESGFGGGGSWLTGAITLGFSRRNRWCQKIEQAKLLWNMGYRRDALHLLCTTGIAKDADLAVCFPWKKVKKSK